MNPTEDNSTQAQLNSTQFHSTPLHSTQPQLNSTQLKHVPSHQDKGDRTDRQTEHVKFIQQKPSTLIHVPSHQDNIAYYPITPRQHRILPKMALPDQNSQNGRILPKIVSAVTFKRGNSTFNRETPGDRTTKQADRQTTFRSADPSRQHF